jgi:hypothetical protein
MQKITQIHQKIYIFGFFITFIIFYIFQKSQKTKNKS